MKPTSISTIDCAGKSPSALASEIRDASVSLGFLYLSHTGLDVEADKIFEVSKGFFLQEKQAEKERCARMADNLGYVALQQETLDPSKNTGGDVKEVFNLGHLSSDRPPQARQPLPAFLEKHAEALADFQRKCHNLCGLILRAMALALQLPDEFFYAQHADDPSDISVLRLLWYPAVPATEEVNDIRAGAHSDYGSITLLFQQRGGCSGLQVLPPSESTDGTWQEVPVIPGGVLVNIGDAMEFWTGGNFKSTIHRVVQQPSASGKESLERFSIAFFCQPKSEAKLFNVVPSLNVSKGDRLRMEMKGVMADEELTAGEHLWRRLNATYKPIASNSD